jgi:hypothetical protein
VWLKIKTKLRKESPNKTKKANEENEKKGERIWQ